MSTIELCTPFNWCDRRCERCPLRDSCPVFLASDRPLEESLGEALALATQILRDEGLTDEEIENLPGPPPPPPLERAIEASAMRWVEAYRDAGGNFLLAMIVGAKVARVAGEETMDDEWLRGASTDPNLLVLERVLEEARTALHASPHAEPRPPAAIQPFSPAVARARFDEADRQLRGFLTPLFAAISAETRAAIDILAAAGRAPSPFCTSGPPAPTGAPEANSANRLAATRE